MQASQTNPNTHGTSHGGQSSRQELAIVLPNSPCFARHLLELHVFLLATAATKVKTEQTMLPDCPRASRFVFWTGTSHKRKPVSEAWPQQLKAVEEPSRLADTEEGQAWGHTLPGPKDNGLKETFGLS
ncbi:hypothetical protein ElyMa_004210400 [Elysia marginata]|uniref:Uncharacterized protein n=1 Tax=Elysia marginata TaxID=1093978 RepID=A0AAV4GP70_9GAST|nr:hypothetical protein ElyMa_004210400 [Elysia marginata]